MLQFHSLRTRAVPAAAFALLGLVLGSCASNPPAPEQQRASEVEPTGIEAYTGRLQVIVTDQNAAYLERASVDLRSLGKNIWRRASTTDPQGKVTFSAVPPDVELNVVHQYGSHTQQIAVPQSGGTIEVRVIIQTFGADQAQEGTDTNAGF